MKYNLVQESLERFVRSNWTITSIQYDNVPFNSDLYTEYLQCHIAFGEGHQRTVTQGCYRQIGILMLTVKTKPGKGPTRKLTLASAASDMVRSVLVLPVAPLVAPSVYLKVPDLINDDKERYGWVSAVVSCPFYYDF